MKLEYLDDMSDGGVYKNVISENLIRLYEFEEPETSRLADLIHHQLIVNKHSVNLSDLDFIKPINCNLILEVSSIDRGILKNGQLNHFTCLLMEQAYKDVIERIKLVGNGNYNWLCDTSIDKIDFLYSSDGTW